MVCFIIPTSLPIGIGLFIRFASCQPLRWNWWPQEQVQSPSCCGGLTGAAVPKIPWSVCYIIYCIYIYLHTCIVHIYDYIRIHTCIYISYIQYSDWSCYFGFSPFWTSPWHNMTTILGFIHFELQLYPVHCVKLALLHAQRGPLEKTSAASSTEG
jgi:hypothetical protein